MDIEKIISSYKDKKQREDEEFEKSLDERNELTKKLLPKTKLIEEMKNIPKSENGVKFSINLKLSEKAKNRMLERLRNCKVFKNIEKDSNPKNEDEESKAIELLKFPIH